MKKTVPIMLLSLCMAVLMCLSATSCSGVWSYLWDRPAETDIDGNLLIIPETESAAETYVPFEGAVEYDEKKVHAGVDIYYDNETGKYRSQIIVIDAGHQAEGNSEKEPVGPESSEMKLKVSWGATGVYTKTEEHVLNLEVALKLRDELMKRGYSVVMIRETAEVNISNKERAEIANKYDAAAFIRIHGNSWPDDPSWNGASTICQREDNPYPDCAAHYGQSRLLAESILPAFCKATRMATYKLQETNDLAGTNWSRVPTVVVEMGFLSNVDDDRRMSQPAFWHMAAEGIANGLDDYFTAMRALETDKTSEDDRIAAKEPSES